MILFEDRIRALLGNFTTAFKATHGTMAGIILLSSLTVTALADESKGPAKVDSEKTLAERQPIVVWLRSADATEWRLARQGAGALRKLAHRSALFRRCDLPALEVLAERLRERGARLGAAFREVPEASSLGGEESAAPKAGAADAKKRDDADPLARLRSRLGLPGKETAPPKMPAKRVSPDGESASWTEALDEDARLVLRVDTDPPRDDAERTRRDAELTRWLAKTPGDGTLLVVLRSKSSESAVFVAGGPFVAGRVFREELDASGLERMLDWVLDRGLSRAPPPRACAQAVKTQTPENAERPLPRKESEGDATQVEVAR